MTYYEQLGKIMKNMNYHKCAKSINNFRIYFNGTGRNDTKVIVLTSTYIITESNAKQIFQQISLIFGYDIPAERILIISNNSRGTCMKAKNIIKLTSKGIKGYVSPLFLDEISSFKKCLLLTKEKRERAMVLYPDSSYNWIIMTVLLIIINVIVFYNNFRLGSANTAGLGISEQTVLNNRENIRLLTYMFMHNSIIHLIINMIGLWMIGTQLERYAGAIRTLAIYISSGLLGGMLSITLSGPLLGKEYVITTGASGAIYGMLGALVVAQCMACEKHLYALTKTAIFYLLILSIGFLRPNVDNLCHIGGFIAGIVFMSIMELSDTNKRYYMYRKLTEKINRKESDIYGCLR